MKGQQTFAGVVTAPDDEKSYEKLIVGRAAELGWLDWHVEKVPVRRPGTHKTVWMTPTSRKGWPDCALLHPLGWFMLLEVKGKDGVLTPEQKELLQMLQTTATAIGSPRFQAWAVWPKDWLALEQWLARPLAGRGGDQC